MKIKNTTHLMDLINNKGLFWVIEYADSTTDIFSHDIELGDDHSYNLLDELLTQVTPNMASKALGEIDIHQHDLLVGLFMYAFTGESKHLDVLDYEDILDAIVKVIKKMDDKDL